MRYQRTQVYLDPDDHRRLVAEAAQRGISLAELMRELVRAHVSERAPTYGEKSFDAIIGIIDTGPQTDIANKFDEYMDDVMDARYRKKMGIKDREPNADEQSQ